MESVGYAALQVVPSLKGFEGKLSAQTTPALTKVGTSGGDKFGSTFATKASSSIRSKFSETAKFIVAPLAAAFAVEGIGRLVGDSISAASDLNESQNKVQQVFKSSANEIFRFTAKASTALGQSDLEARNAAASFGIFGRAAGLNDTKTANFAVRMDKLAGDLASFHNTSPDQAIEAIGAALRGESEPIRAYGILLNDASLKAEALRLGLLKPVKDQAKIHSYQVKVLEDQKAYNDAIGTSGSKSLEAMKAQATLGSAQEALRKATEGTVPTLTQQQKILASQSLILKQSSVAQGDFTRTSGGLANQQRILSASWENAKTKLGRGLLPVVNDFVHFINREGIPVVNEFSDWFAKKGAPGIGDFVRGAKPLANSILPAIGTGFKDVGGFLRDAAPRAKAVIDAFNSLPGWAQKSIVLGTAGGLLAKKTGVLSFGKGALGGGGGGILGLVSKAKPVPVFVTNEGFGGAGIRGAGSTGGNLARSLPLVGAAVIAGGVSKKFADDERAKNLKQFGTNDLVDIALTKLERAQRAAFVKDFGDKNKLTIDLSPRARADLAAARKLQERGFAVTPNGQTLIGHKLDPTQLLLRYGLTAQQARGLLDIPELRATSTRVDVLNAKLGKTSQGLDMIGRSGTRNYDGLAAKTRQYADQLRRMPKDIRTKIDLDTTEAERRIATLHAHAGRHISASLSIELAGNSPQQRALDGVRR